MRPFEQLLDSMDYLVHGNRMLAGLGVCYGTARDSRHALCGNAQEVLLGPDGFAPAARPLTGRTLYDLASLTKLFTCLCVLRLREDGRLSLDERFGEADPRFPGLRDVTVGDVLSFRAYLRSPSRVDEAANRTEALARVFAIAPAAPPAVKRYTDMNALALGHLVESRADMELYEYVQRAVLRPAGMTETFCRVPPQRLGDCANYNYECRLTDGRPVLRTDAPPGTPHDPKARVLGDGGRHLSGHAGLFSTLGDMTRLAQALLSGEVLPPAVVREIGVNRTGRPNADGTHVQYLGYQCFSRHPQQRLSEVPAYMGPCALGLSGFTGNHLSLDPEAGVFALFLGNRAHARLTTLVPPRGLSEADFGLDADGAGRVCWPSGLASPAPGLALWSSVRYVYQKDKRLHAPIWADMEALGWLVSSRRESPCR